jgi:thiol-disulfide isomerase/thioredoxin
MTDRFTSADAPIMAHPSLSVWEDELFTHGAVVDVALQTHMAQCATCAGTVSALQSLNATLQQSGAAVATYASTHDALRARILDSRARGVRTAIPAAAPEPEELYDNEHAAHTEHAARAAADSVPAPWWTRSTVRAAAAVLAAIGIVSLWRQPTAAEAGMVAGSLDLSPAMPRVGDTVRVTYTTAGLLGKPPVLRLRARIRTVHHDSYNDGIPVVQLATLHRTSGDRYRAQFVLPDSVVFAALAVEDTAASAVDDFGGRAWEVLRAGADGRPLLDALEQRAHDLMGRSWEEGIATAREEVRLYPDSVRSWSSLSFYEGAMGLENDSTLRVHARQARKFSDRMLSGVLPMQAGQLYWYARGTPDSTLTAAWRVRLLRDAPQDGFAVQERTIDIFRTHLVSKDSAGAIAALEVLWSDTPIGRRAQVAQVAHAFIGTSAQHADAMRRWTARALAADSTFYRRRWVARELSRVAGLRDTALATFESFAASLERPDDRYRGLSESRAEYARRVSAERTIADAEIGRILAQGGRATEALTRLRRASDVGWNLEVFDVTATAALAAGDTALAVPQWARLVIDPRTTPSRALRLDSLGTRYAGAGNWATLLQRTRQEMAEVVMGRARRRRVEPSVVKALDGPETALSAVANGRPMVVVFWSPQCGPAVEALPKLELLSQKLAARQVPLVLIAEQTSADSTLTRELRKGGFTGAVYLDARREAYKAFGNWGTPQLYVLDRDGRVLFDATSSVGETELRVEALLSSTSTPVNSSRTH